MSEDATGPSVPAATIEAAVPPVFAAAPPTLPGPLGVSGHEKALWPAILGGVCIAMGVFGVMAAVWSAASSFMLEWMGGLAPPEQPNPFAAMTAWKWPLFGASLALVPIGGLLIAGGVGMCRRRRWSVGVIRWWAVLKILGGVALSLVTALMQREQMSAFMTASATAGTSVGGGAVAVGVGGTGVAANGAIVGDVMFWLTLLGSSAWYAALPVMLLVWFALPFVRRETGKWARPGAAGATA